MLDICLRTRLLKGNYYTIADLCDWSFNRVASRLRGAFKLQPKTVLKLIF